MLTTVAVSPRIAQKAAELRASLGLKTPDAIQAATGIDCEAAFLVTNDRDFHGVAGTRVIHLSEFIA